MIRAGTIEPHPQLIAFTTARRADVCVRVVPVDSPRGKNAFRETVFAGTAHVVHDLLTAVFDDRFANAPGERVECLVPRGAFPASFAAFPAAFEWIQNSIGIGYLVERRRTFCAIASA